MTDKGAATHPTTAAEIAAGLSAAQKKAIMGAKEAAWGKDIWLVRAFISTPTMECLNRLGLMNNAINSRALSTLGREVQEAVRQLTEGEARAQAKAKP